MPEYQLKKLRGHVKKYLVITPDNRRIRFGQSGYSDFTKHKDPQRKTNYLNRHRNEDWTNLNKPGTWARYLLWNKPTLAESIKSMEKRFNIKIYI